MIQDVGERVAARDDLRLLPVARETVVRSIDGSQIILGPPLMFTKQNVDLFDF